MTEKWKEITWLFLELEHHKTSCSKQAIKRVHSPFGLMLKDLSSVFESFYTSVLESFNLKVP